MLLLSMMRWFSVCVRARYIIKPTTEGESLRTSSSNSMDNHKQAFARLNVFGLPQP